MDTSINDLPMNCIESLNIVDTKNMDTSIHDLPMNCIECILKFLAQPSVERYLVLNLFVKKIICNIPSQDVMDFMDISPNSPDHPANQKYNLTIKSSISRMIWANSMGNNLIKVTHSPTENDDLELLKWLSDNGCQFNNRESYKTKNWGSIITYDVVYYDNLELLQWLWYNGCEFSCLTAQMAVEDSAYRVCEWLAELSEYNICDASKESLRDEVKRIDAARKKFNLKQEQLALEQEQE